MLFPFDALTTKPIYFELFPSFLTIIWVGTFEIRLKKSGPLEDPLVKVSPKLPTRILFCLKAITLDSQPFDPVSNMVTVTKVVTGHAPKIQNSESNSFAVKLLPGIL